MNSCENDPGVWPHLGNSHLDTTMSKPESIGIKIGSWALNARKGGETLDIRPTNITLIVTPCQGSRTNRSLKKTQKCLIDHLTS